MKFKTDPRLIDAIKTTATSPCIPENERENLMASEKAAAQVYGRFRAFRCLMFMYLIMATSFALAFTIIAITTGSNGLHALWVSEIGFVVFLVLSISWNSRFQARMQKVEDDLKRVVRKHKEEVYLCPPYAVILGPHSSAWRACILRIVDSNEEIYNHGNFDASFIETTMGTHYEISLRKKRGEFTHQVSGSAIYALDLKLGVTVLWEENKGDKQPMANPVKPVKSAAKPSQPQPSEPARAAKPEAVQNDDIPERALREKLEKLHGLVGEGIIEEADYQARKEALIRSYLGE